jgi:hypothetical protein
VPRAWPLLLVVIACGRTEPLDGLPLAAPPDAGRSDAGTRDAGVPTSCTNPPGPETGQRCRRTVRFDVVRPSRASCFIDVRLDAGELGTLEWDCGQTQGLAELRFARARFTGVVAADTASLCFGSAFDWTDGCRWTSAQTISGALDAGRLGFTYGEAPLAGQSGCETPCTGAGSLTVVP